MNEKLASSLPQLEPYGNEILKQLVQVTDERKMLLHQISEFVSQRIQNGRIANLLFICTHNSRRSIIAQLWATAAACFFNLENVRCFSGGTEATQIPDSIMTALRLSGFQLTGSIDEPPQTVRAKWCDENDGVELFSKTVDHQANPSSDFMAIMVCDEADEHCPVVPGASARLALPFTDPKAWDGMPEQTAKYEEMVFLIASEMLYAMSLVQNAISA